MIEREKSYILSIILCFFGYFFSKSKIWLYLLIVTFSGSIIISGYHLGIENGVFVKFNLNTLFLISISTNFLRLSELQEFLYCYYFLWHSIYLKNLFINNNIVKKFN